MEFEKALNPKTIVTHLNVSSKAEALDAMAGILLQANVINDKDVFIKDVYLREEIGETGMGNYIAIPHGRSEAVITPGVAVAILEHAVEWESYDDSGARIVVLFAVGTDNAAAEEHLEMLAMFSKRLGNDAVVQRLLRADTVDQVIEAFTSEDDSDEDDLGDSAELDLDEITIV